MQNFFYILVLLFLIISCNKEKEKTKTQINKKVVQDSITVSDFGEHKSIHQEEWEKYREKLGVDTVKTNLSF